MNSCRALKIVFGGMRLKRVGVLLIFVLILIFCLPLLLMKSCQDEKLGEIKSKQQIKIKIYNVENNKVQEMDLEQYVLGVVAAEMPAKFNIEALKAQALAARTYTLLRLKYFGGKGCLNHPGADICTDSAHCQAYREPKSLGKDYEKLKQAVMDTEGQVIVYQSKLIDAVFHSTSGGKTENSEEIWTNKIPYLRSVISEYEDESPKLISQKEIPIDSFISCIEGLDSSIKLNRKKLSSQVKILERSDGGRITRIKIGDKEFKGEEIKSAIGLNSANFTIKLSKNTALFTVIGYGHGIGMSQYGADGMAQHGAKYEAIIKHYYKGVEIIDLKDILQTEK